MKLAQTPYFAEIIYLIEQRIKMDDRQKLFNKVQLIICDYIAEFEKVLSLIEEAIITLDEGLKKNELEEFHLSESRELYDSYMQTFRKLGILSQFGLLFFETLTDKMYSPISEIIYAGSVLTSASKYCIWGK